MLVEWAYGLAAAAAEAEHVCTRASACNKCRVTNRCPPLQALCCLLFTLSHDYVALFRLLPEDCLSLILPFVYLPFPRQYLPLPTCPVSVMQMPMLLCSCSSSPPSPSIGARAFLGSLCEPAAVARLVCSGGSEFPPHRTGDFSWVSVLLPSSLPHLFISSPSLPENGKLLTAKNR